MSWGSWYGAGARVREPSGAVVAPTAGGHHPPQPQGTREGPRLLEPRDSWTEEERSNVARGLRESGHFKHHRELRQKQNGRGE